MHKVNSIKAPQIEKLIVLLREMYDIVLIDTPNFPTDDVVLTPVQYSDKNILIIEPNFINIVSASKIFYIFETLEENIKESIKDKTFIVLNRDKKKSSINNETTRMFLEGKKLVVRLPEDPEYISLINKGTLISESNSEMIGPIKKLSQFMFDHQEEIKKKKKSLFSGLLNRKK
jgi:cellulose biosynthesis protein BcsQ